uniref:DUF4550 domain-containing protein n=3 Tax=Molossus molossus TaxID=27622 RepID=A0A7J8I7B0_MOLMO|nr:hypothetical protein HJG59_007264 [Molossus molossus]
MSLHAWDWEDEDMGSMGPMSSMGSFCPSMSECEVEEYLNASGQAQDSDSDHLYSSMESLDGRANTFNSDVPQVVPCKFTISLAFPSNVGHKGKFSSFVKKYRKRSKMDKPVAKSHRVYHIEYFLLPDDKEPKTADLVVFQSVVKVFLDSGVKIVRPWHEGDKVWVSWTQVFNINMTKELLKKMNFYKITLKLWDNTDKVSKKIKYSRLKISGYLEEAGSFGKSEEVKQMVLNQRSPPEQNIQVKEEWSQEYELEKLEKAGKHLKPLHVKWKESDRGKKKMKRRKKCQTEEEADPKLADYWKQGAFTIQLAVMPLLAGWQSVVSRGSKISANILDCFLTLKTEGPIMTEEQKQDLNPLIIKIKCISCLPSQPVPIHDLERLCSPVYCRYQFHKTPVHQTEGKPHGSHISFQDINVIFLGTMHPSELREYLEGPPMVVEVHDRDRKSEEYSRKPTLFGEDPLDSCLNFQVLISPKETENNPFETQTKIWDPYGVARVSFADLLLGHKYLNLAIPIHSCESKPTQHGHDSKIRKVVGFRVPTDVLHHGPMPMGNYLESNSLLKLRVDIAVPLRTMAETPSADLTGTKFGRIIFVFGSRKIFLLYNLLQDITMINAKALDLDSYPITNIQQILSAIKIRVNIQERQDLDVLTGFYLLDGKIHLLILEGLADQGLKRLWESYQSRTPKSEHRKYKVLYNSQLLFQNRLYADLDTILYHVHLFKPLTELMKQTALHLHSTGMRKAFQTLTKIYCICLYSSKLREVITGDLLPSSDMIRDLSQEFGLPISLEEIANETLWTIPSHPTSNLEDFQSRNSTLTHEILAHQEKYLRWRNTAMMKYKGKNRSLIQKNIAEAYQVSKKPPKSLVKVIRSSASATGAVYNYSMQTLNSTELAKKELYCEMAKEPRKRFTYSQKYLSAMVEPQDSKEEEKKAKEKSRKAWLTASGFQVAGLHRSDHYLQLLPPCATTQEWRENALLANVLKPVLDRERWSWDQRHRDFDLYKKPPPFLKLPAPPARDPAAGKKMKGSGPVS